MPTPAQLIYEAGSLEIDSGKRELRARGVPVPIGGRAFEIIEALVQSAGELVTKDDLMGKVWPGAVVGESTIQVHISAIRKALGRDRAILQTASGRGYRLLGRWATKQREASEGRAHLVPVRVPAEPPQGNLPTSPSDLIGRASAILQLRDLMSAYRIVTLAGPGGIGKTRLALETAHVLSPAFSGGAWFVELAALPDASLVAATIASVIGVHLAGNDVSPVALARAIGGRKLLLVLDNCEHVIDTAAGIVETVVRLCPAVSVLATSREHMRIDGECTYRVQPLDLPTLEPPGQNVSRTDQNHILEAGAVQLFIARATAWQSGLQQQQGLSAIAAICRRLDGIPLAIEFAAARAATLGFEEVLSRLDDRFALLTTGRRTALPKNRTLRATLDWSYDLLSGLERILLRRLAVFAAAFSLEAASAVTGGGKAPSEDITDCLATDIADGIENLVAKSLVTAEIVGEVAHFRLLETTRAYAYEKLAESGESQHLARRHAHYYQVLLERIEDERETRPAQLADLGNARAALEWCFGVSGDAEIGVHLAAAAARVFLAMSFITECHRWSERAILTLSGSSRGGREEMHLQAALGMSSMYTRGQGEAALRALQRSLAIAEASNDYVMELRLLGPLYLFHLRIGDLKVTLRNARRMSTVSETIADQPALAIAHSLLGLTLQLMGNLGDAQNELEAALSHGPGSRRAITTNLGFDGRTIARVSLARNLWLRGYPVKATELVREAVSDVVSLDHPVAIFPVLIWGFSVFHWKGDLQTAGEYADFFISRAESYSLGPYLAVGRGFKGQLDILGGDPNRGVESLRGCLAELHEARYELLTTPFNISLAQGLAATGEFTDSIRLTNETIELVEANGDHCYLPELLRVKARALLLLSSDSHHEAEMYFRRSLELSRRQGARAWELRAGTDLARLLMARGEAETARSVLQPVLKQFTEGLDNPDLKAAACVLETLG